MINLYFPEINEYKYIPSHLGECDAKQYADMAKLIYQFQKNQINYENFKTLSVYILLNMKRSKKKDSIIYQNVYALGTLVESFFEKKEVDNGYHFQIKQHYVNNHLPSLRVGLFTKLYGPFDVFEYVSFGQYVDGLEEFINYSQTEDIYYLRKLFAIFYLKKNEKYNPITATARAKGMLRNIDIRHLYGFYLYFSSMQLFIMSGEIIVQGNSIDLSIIYENGEIKESNIPGIGMYGLLNDIAESGVFGPQMQTRNTNMWDILKYLYHLQKKNKENEPNTIK